MPTRRRALFVVSTECEHCGERVGVTIPNETRRLLLEAGSGTLLLLRCRTRCCGKDVPLGRDDLMAAKLLGARRVAKLQG